MAKPQAGRPIAILAGSGDLPRLLAEAIRQAGDEPVIFPIAGEADISDFADFTAHKIRWGGIGDFLRLVRDAGCKEAVLIGGVTRRPDFKALRPDLGALAFLPRILKLLRRGDDGALSEVAKMFAENGMTLVDPLSVAPELALPEGLVAGTNPPADLRTDMELAAQAARAIGRLDIGQAAVAVDGRVIALEGAEGTDGMLQRVAQLRVAGRIAKSGGVLVKCMKPNQDPRLDLPGIGPKTAIAARHADLDGVAGEAGRALLAGRAETIAAFEDEGLFLIGLPRPSDETGVDGDA
jgi:DUF1009 family protein